MKKSTLIATIAVISAVATLAATNLKLKSEYRKGIIKDPYTKTKLAPFRHIKVVFDSSSANGENFKINVSKKSEPCIAIFHSEKMKLLVTVSNDTLIVKNDPADKGYSYMDAVIITTPELKGISVTKGSYQISQGETDSLIVTANDKSIVNLSLKKIRLLTIKATDNASIVVTSKDTISGADIQLADKSSFNAKDIIIKQKKLQLSDSATLHLTGRSMKVFGVQ